MKYFLVIQCIAVTLLGCTSQPHRQTAEVTIEEVENGFRVNGEMMDGDHVISLLKALEKDSAELSYNFKDKRVDSSDEKVLNLVKSFKHVHWEFPTGMEQNGGSTEGENRIRRL